MPANSSSVPLPLDLYELTAQDRVRFADDSMLGLVTPQHPILSQIAAVVSDVAIASGTVQPLVNLLLKTAQGQRDSKHADKRKGRGMVGLAAPQIGHDYRVIVVDTEITKGREQFGTLQCFINPRIIWRSRETAEGREGCFSTGSVWGIVRRPVAVKIEAQTPEGEVIQVIFEDFTARIVQHEIDHLDGIRFPDRIKSDAKRHWVHVEELEAYVKQYKHWPRLCSQSRWEACKH
jgi:peptide deformylase